VKYLPLIISILIEPYLFIPAIIISTLLIYVFTVLNNFLKRPNNYYNLTEDE